MTAYGMAAIQTTKTFKDSPTKDAGAGASGSSISPVFGPSSIQVFSELDEWLKNEGENNRWVRRIDMCFVIDHDFLDKSSRCCGFYHYTGKLVRHSSDGNPIIWINIGK